MKTIPVLAFLLLAAAGRAQDDGTASAGGPPFNRRTPVVLAVERVGPAVVNLRTQSYVRRPHFFGSLFQQPDESMLADRSLGSGVIVHADGYAVTNEHVVHGADRIEAALPDGRTVEAELLNADRENDLAVLKLRASGPFPAATLGDSGDLMVGEPTIALGNPFGLSSSVTTGILSAIGRSVRFQGRAHFTDFLQTSALINPGNSGGPLLDINGRVIGISVAIDNRAQGIGFAIPANRVREVMVELLEPEVIRNAWLGIECREAPEGLRVERVLPESPAAERGVKAGDRILTVDGAAVRDRLDFNVALLKHQAEETVALGIVRTGHSVPMAVVSVPLAPAPLARIAQGSLKLHGMECANLSENLVRRLNLPRDLHGVVVLSVAPDSASAELGLESGDVVYQVGRFAISDLPTLDRVFRTYERAEGRAPLRVYRYRTGELLKGTIALQ